MQTRNTFYRGCISYNLIVSLVLIFSFSGVIAQNSDNSQSQATQIIVKHKQSVQASFARSNSAVDLGPGLKLRQSIIFMPAVNTPALPNRAPSASNSSSLEFDVIQIEDSSMSIADAMKHLRDTGLYEYVEPDFPLELDLAGDDPLLPSQWALDSSAITDTEADINAYQAWDMTTGGPDVVIAVLDSGIDYTHPDLIDNIWVNAGEIPADGLDNDGNGVVDDIHGLDARNRDGDPIDERGHGTHVAGILAAKGNNGLGISGLGWSFKLMPVQIFGESGRGATSDAIYGLNYVHMMKTRYGVNINITNNSWGGGSYSQALKDTIGLLADDGIMFVTSAGNDGTNSDYKPYYPAGYGNANIITVGAVGPNSGTSLDQVHRPGFSNTGFTSVDLAAPGVDILSTKMENGLACQADSGITGFSLCSGTSMAVPLVSATLGLLESLYPGGDLFTNRQKVIRSVGYSPQSVTQSWHDQSGQWSRTGGILKADKALLYDGFTLNKDYLYAEAVRTLGQPLDQTYNESVTLGAIKSQGINWIANSDATWLTTTKNSGIASNSLSTNIPVKIKTNNRQTGIYRGRITFSDVSSVAQDVSVPVRMAIKTKPADMDPQVLKRPGSLGNSKQFANALAVQNRQAFIAETAEQGGAVHVYDYFDKFWVFTGSILSPQPNKASAFGSALAVFEDTLFIGSELDDTNGTFAGAVYVYEKTAGQWQQTQKIVPSGDSFKFGTRLAVDQDNLAVMGARNVFLYQKIQGLWTEVQTISTVSNTIATNLDGDIALQDEVLVVTNPGSGSSGTGKNANIYEFINGSWMFAESILDHSGFNFYLGDIDLHDGKILVISSPPDTGNNPGVEAYGSISFRIYQRFDGSWVFDQYDLASGRDGVGFDFNAVSTGRDSVILTDDEIYVSSVSDHHFGNGNSGAVYRYKKTQGSYRLAAKFIPQLNTYSSSFDFGFGSSMAAFGNKVMVAGAGSDAHQSHVEAFDFTSSGRLESLTVYQVDDQWKQVSLKNTYDSMIPVCSVNYVNNTSPAVIRIRNTGISSFEIKLQNPGDLVALAPDVVHCIIAEEGAWTLPNGDLFEAKKYTSTLTASLDNWANSDFRIYDNSYVKPVVLGQVISYNDPDWSVFWSRGTKTSNNASMQSLRTGKHVGEDTRKNRADELIGYMVFESAISNIGNLQYQSDITPEIIRDLGASNNQVDIGIADPPKFAIVSLSGSDGGNGSWPVLNGSEALSQGILKIAVDEDQINDPERLHISENVSFFTASSHLNISLRPVSAQIQN